MEDKQEVVQMDIDVPKKKKGRPRKEKADVSENVDTNAMSLEPEKKKRGRKKKEVVVEEVKQKKKRGRKAAVKYFSSSIRKKIPLTTVIQDNNNYILHLDIKDEGEVAKEGAETYENDDIAEGLLESLFKKLDINKDSKSQTSEYVEFDTTNVANVAKEIQEMLTNDQSILSDLLDDPCNSDEKSLRELYERRIEYRETQDKILVDKLEMLHKDDEIMNKLSRQTLCTDNVLVEKNDEETKRKQQEVNRKKGYFELLYAFVHNTEWLEKTNVACWWCCHEFDDVPLGLPVEFVTRLRKFMVKGIFCSFACMVAYKNDKKIYNKDHLIKYLYTKLTGRLLNDVSLKSAPMRCALKMFGGELTIDEFRKSTDNGKIYKMVEYPMFIAKDYVEEIDIANVKNVNTNLFDDNAFNKTVNLDEKRINDAKMRLSKIEKTTVTVGNTIDKFIKIG